MSQAIGTSSVSCAAALQYNGDIDMRSAFYIQVTMLVLLVKGIPQLALEALWTLIGTCKMRRDNSLVVVASIIQTSKLSLSECTENSEIKLVILFGLQLTAQTTGRKVVLAFASLVLFAYVCVTGYEIQAYMRHRINNRRNLEGGEHAAHRKRYERREVYNRLSSPINFESRKVTRCFQVLSLRVVTPSIFAVVRCIRKLYGWYTVKFGGATRRDSA
ncbi:hypothetical protein BU17DRAFT_68722 [Hysterangium stoloniferum]|nr:hypothetical protein BU17DRAFT_68722 [Hysterangium stoloniferum]